MVRNEDENENVRWGEARVWDGWRDVFVVSKRG